MSTPKAMSTSILDRFRALMKERDDELRASMGDDFDVPPPTMDEISSLYQVFLSDLTLNSKPIITDLTIIAGEHKHHAEGIADAICSRIIEAPVEHKLPSLYLLDSIVKNLGREYVRHFSARLPEVFFEAYNQMHPSMYSAMRHLFGTWSTVFPASVLHKIETGLSLSHSGANQSSGLTPSRASESPRPTHGIHVNPKYLEARRQLGLSSVDSVRAEKLNSTGNAGQSSSNLDAKPLPFTASKNARSSPPYRIGSGSLSSPSLDEFAVDNSAIRLTERASPSHSRLDSGLSRVRGRDDERSEWQRTLPDETNQHLDYPVTYSVNDGIDLQGPRALINAYGIDEREKLVNHRQMKIGNAAINGFGKRISTKTWHNTEEEEFNWEDMSPTLADHSHSNEFSTSVCPSQGVRRRPVVDSHALVADPRRSWSSRGQHSLVNSSSVDDGHLISSGQGARNKITGYCNEASLISGSHYLQNSPQNLQQSHQNPLTGEGSGISSSTSEHKSPMIRNLAAADGHTWRPESVPPRMNPSFDSSVQGIRAVTGRASTVSWPPADVHNPQLSTSTSAILPHNQISSPFDTMNASNSLVNLSHSKPVFPEKRSAQFPTQHPTPYPLSEPQRFRSQHIRQTTVPPSSVLAPNRLLLPPSHGYTPQGPGSSLLPLPVSGPHVSMPMVNFPNTSSPFHPGALPPLPRGPPPPLSSQIMPTHNLGLVTPNLSTNGAFSSLFDSLVAQGVLSLTNQAPTQDLEGLEFNPELLKVRRDSAINALYNDLPRQCTTCGVRFKCQETHSSHMDWHVTKNRVSRNRKQKLSRKWFVSVNMWLSGTEALGSDAVPGFLPLEQVVEKKDDEELAVPADDEQNVCALCGEPFEDFYSDETEEWMYRGAVYMNAPTGSTVGMDRSQLGSIVHAKCMSESSAIPLEDSRNNDEGHMDDGSQRKRMRS